MSKTASERKRIQRKKKSQGGLFKPYEIYIHPLDLAELKEVEYKLQNKRLKPEEIKMTTVAEFLKSKDCVGNEILAHSVTANAQTSKEWAEEFIAEGWAHEDFDTLEDITDKVKSGEIVINSNGVAVYA